MSAIQYRDMWHTWFTLKAVKNAQKQHNSRQVAVSPTPIGLGSQKKIPHLQGDQGRAR